MINQKQNIDKHVFLVGRPPMSEFLGVVNSQVDYDHSQLGSLADEWRVANQHVVALQQKEANVANNPAYLDVPDSLKELANQTLEDTIFQRAFAS